MADGVFVEASHPPPN